MKIIQFIHPMFLTALGLHASLLFVPIGGDAEPELLEEDVPIAELTADASKAATSPTANKLPVPDPNVSTGAAKPNPTKAKPANPSAIVQPKPAPRPVAVKPATPAGTAAGAAAVPATTGAVAASGSGSSVGDAIRSAAGENSNSSASSSGSEGSALGNPRGSDVQAAGEVTTPVVESPPSQQTSFIPDLSAPDNAESNTGDSGEGGTSIPVENAKLAALVAALPRETVVPDALEASVLALQEALIYRAEGTKDETAEQLREAWINAVSRQANSAGSVERIEPTVQDDVQLAYPMASSVLREGRSLNVCLDEEPSNAEIGVLFDSEGKLAVDPAILRSTGYQALDLEAIAMVTDEENLANINENTSQEDRSNKAYIFEIEVEYDEKACIAP